MIDERRVKLMTRMAFYEANEGREDLKISGYYRKDYTSLHGLLTLIWGTLGYIALLVLVGVAMFDELLASLNTGTVILIGSGVIIGYFAMIIVYIIITHAYSSRVHQRARTRVKKYNHDLIRLLKIYEKEKR